MIRQGLPSFQEKESSMKPANLWMRAPLFVLALALGAVNWGANPVS